MTILLLFGGTDTTVQDRNDRRGTGAGAALGPQLFAARYNVAGTVQKEVVYRPANVGIRWALPGGLQRMEFTVRAKSREDARNRYSEGLGDRWILLDANIDRPIADGWCYEIIPDGLHVHYVVGGAWKRHAKRYATAAPAEADTTNEYIADQIIPNLGTGIVSASTAHLSATSTAIGTYSTQDVGRPIMEYPQLVNDMIAMGNSSDQIMDYWVVPAPMSGIYPLAPYVYFQPRDDTDSISWQCRERDLSALDMSRNIWDLANNIYIGYQFKTRVSTLAGVGATEVFIDDISGFAAENEIEIHTATRTITADVLSVGGTSLELVEALPAEVNEDDIVVNKTITNTAAGSDATSIADFWNATFREDKPELNATQAAQYRDALLAQYKDPAQLASFTIGSGFVRDGVGNRVPVWRMLINPGIIRINDLFADGATFTNSIDGRQSFRIVALDYDHNSRSMRVTPDTLNEARLDVLLQRAGISGVGQMIDRS